MLIDPVTLTFQPQNHTIKVINHTKSEHLGSIHL